MDEKKIVNIGTEHQTGAEQHGAQTGRGGTYLKRFLAIVFTLVLLAAAVLAVVYRDKLNFDGIRRMMTYQSLERDENGQAEEIFFESGDSNSYASLENCLLVATGNHIHLFNQTGGDYLEEETVLQTPMISEADPYAVVYDGEGTKLYLLEGKKLSGSITCEGRIYSARVNETGFVTVTHEATGYKGVVTVYDSKLEPRMQVSISSAFVMDAAASPDGKQAAVITIGESDGAFCSRVVFYDVSSGEEISSVELPGQLVLEPRWFGSSLRVQTDQGVSTMNSTDGLTGLWKEEDLYLWGYGFTDEAQVLATAMYQTGYQGAVILVDDQGQEVNRLEVNQKVLSISTTDQYIALLFTNRLEIYTSNLELYSELNDTAGARKVLMRSDGSALLVGAESATLYVP